MGSNQEEWCRLAVITGASRGYGEALAETFHSSHKLLLVSRWQGEEGQKNLKYWRGKKNVICCPGDLGSAKSAKDWFDNHAKKVLEEKQFSELVIIQNAGEIFEVKYADHLDPSAVQNDANLNVASFMALTSMFLDFAYSNSKVQKLKVINISSLLAVQPGNGFALYCAGKAARDMFIKVCAQESRIRAKDKKVKFLNYAPGPMKTLMFENICENIEDPETKEMFKVHYYFIKMQIYNITVM